jgi:hypothetical protein
MQMELVNMTVEQLEAQRSMIERMMKVKKLQAQRDLIDAELEDLNGDDLVKGASEKVVDICERGSTGPRIGEDYQASIPDVQDRSSYLAGCLVDHHMPCEKKCVTGPRSAPKKICKTPGCNLDNGHGMRTRSNSKRLRESSVCKVPCGTPGCHLEYGHIGPHAMEQLNAKRSCTYKAPKYSDRVEEDEAEEQKAQQEKVNEHEHKQEKKTPSSVARDPPNIKHTYDKGHRLMGSTGKMVQMDDRRRALIEMWRKKHGNVLGSDAAGKDAVMDELKAILIMDGKSEGSVGPSGNFRCDGVVYTRAKFLGYAFDAGVFKTRKDVFAPGAKEKACSFYQTKAAEVATKTDQYAKLKTYMAKKLLIQKYFKAFKRGFDRFVGF